MVCFGSAGLALLGMVTAMIFLGVAGWAGRVLGLVRYVAGLAARRPA